MTLLRASTDQSALDMKISNLVWAIVFNLVQILGNIVVMSQAAWQVFIVLFPVMAACIWYQVAFWIMSPNESNFDFHSSYFIFQGTCLTCI